MLMDRLVGQMFCDSHLELGAHTAPTKSRKNSRARFHSLARRKRQAKKRKKKRRRRREATASEAIEIGDGDIGGSETADIPYSPSLCFPSKPMPLVHSSPPRKSEKISPSHLGNKVHWRLWTKPQTQFPRTQFLTLICANEFAHFGTSFWQIRKRHEFNLHKFYSTVNKNAIFCLS